MIKNNIAKSIANRVKEAKPGTIFFPSDLLEYGSPETIHTAFSRLAATKQLTRLAKGVYLKPAIDTELGPLKPSLSIGFQSAVKGHFSEVLLHFPDDFVKIGQIPDLVVHRVFPTGFVLRQAICQFLKEIGWLHSLMSAFSAEFMVVKFRM
jgi:Family of unknown function (DUF6088)